MEEMAASRSRSRAAATRLTSTGAFSRRSATEVRSVFGGINLFWRRFIGQVRIGDNEASPLSQLLLSAQTAWGRIRAPPPRDTAGCQPAVSRAGSLHRPQPAESTVRSWPLPVANRRHGRLPVCAAGAVRGCAHGLAVKFRPGKTSPAKRAAEPARRVWAGGGEDWRLGPSPFERPVFPPHPVSPGLDTPGKRAAGPCKWHRR